MADSRRALSLLLSCPLQICVSLADLIIADSSAVLPCSQIHPQCAPTCSADFLSPPTMSSLPSSLPLASALSSIDPTPSFSVQADWEAVLREFQTAARTGGAAVAKLPKESKQFWISVARFGEETSQREGVAHLEEATKAEVAAAAAAATVAAEAKTPVAASSSSSSSTSAASSLSAAARAIHAHVHMDGSRYARHEELGPDTDLSLQFRTPLQLVAQCASISYGSSSVAAATGDRSSSSSSAPCIRRGPLTQLIQAPRATYTHLHARGDIFSIDLNPAGTLGASGGEEGSLRVWDATSAATLKADLVGHKGDITLARWFPSGSVVLSASLDCSVKIWATDPEPVVAAELRGHTRPVSQVVFVGRGRQLFTASEDGTVRLWDVSRQASLSTYPAHKDSAAPELNALVLMDPQAHPIALPSSSADASASTVNDVSELSGHLLLTGGSDGIIRGFDVRAGSQVMMLSTGGRAGGVDALCVGPKPSSLLFGTSEGALCMVDLRAMQPLVTMRQDDAAITTLRTWDEGSFWSSSSTGAINLWKLPGGAGGVDEPSYVPHIVAQLSGVDCEPVHDLSLSSSVAFVASHNAVRSYVLTNLPSYSSAASAQAKCRCECCGFLTVDAGASSSGSAAATAPCPVCAWLPDAASNAYSLQDAQQNFRTFHAADPRWVARTRAPEPNELS